MIVLRPTISKQTWHTFRTLHLLKMKRGVYIYVEQSSARPGGGDRWLQRWGSRAVRLGLM